MYITILLLYASITATPYICKSTFCLSFIFYYYIVYTHTHTYIYHFINDEHYLYLYILYRVQLLWSVRKISGMTF